MPTLPINEAALREAMRDRRYWQPGHPERERYGAWVTGAAPDQGADTVVHVRAYERRGPDGDVIQVQAHTRGASPRPWENQPNPEWRARIAEREVRGIAENFGYGARNPGSSAMGRYQVLSAALQESGWKDSAGGWTDRARRAGVTSDDDFLANPQAREAAFGDYMASNEVRLQNRGLFRLSGRTIRGASGKDVPVTDAGLAAAAHRAGVTAVARYFERRARNAPAEGADLAMETRLREFSTVPYRRAGQR
jgi:hypothetical protein